MAEGETSEVIEEDEEELAKVILRNKPRKNHPRKTKRLKLKGNYVMVKS